MPGSIGPSGAGPEIKWNTLRFGHFLLKAGDEAAIFSNGPTVDLLREDRGQFPSRYRIS
jgi:hypothetical protein